MLIKTLANDPRNSPNKLKSLFHRVMSIDFHFFHFLSLNFRGGAVQCAMEGKILEFKFIRHYTFIRNTRTRVLISKTGLTAA